MDKIFSLLFGVVYTLHHSCVLYINIQYKISNIKAIFGALRMFLSLPCLFPVVNLHTNTCVRWLGRSENNRFLHLALFQGAGKPKQKMDMEMTASDNPMLDSILVDPILFCTSFKKNRFYMFSQRNPDETHTWVEACCSSVGVVVVVMVVVLLCFVGGDGCCCANYCTDGFGKLSQL